MYVLYRALYYSDIVIYCYDASFIVPAGVSVCHEGCDEPRC